MLNQNILLLLVFLVSQPMDGMFRVKPFVSTAVLVGAMITTDQALRCSSIKDSRCFGKWDCPDEKLKAVAVNKANYARYPELQKLVQKYKCSKQALVGQNDSYILKMFGGIDRLINAERMKFVIAQEKLDRLYVPDKCICNSQLSEVWKEEHDFMFRVEIETVYEYGILAQRVKGRFLTHLSLIEVQQLAKLGERTGFADWHKGNLLRDAQGRIAVIDTEDDSFFAKRTCEALWHLHYQQGSVMSPEARQWLQQRITELYESSNDQINVRLPYNVELDDQDGIDRSLAKREYSKYTDE